MNASQNGVGFSLFLLKYLIFENKKVGERRFCRGKLSAFMLVSTSLSAPMAHAAGVQLGDVTITLQSTLGYTLGVRTAPVNNGALGLNTDDGDRNFRSGIMENRFQTLEQLGVVDGNYGFRASALAWIDTAYLQRNKNNSPYTVNAFGVGPQGFPSGTVANEGRRIEPLAAFIYGSEYFANGDQKLSWQIGRQTITWGESLFSLDGISSLQAPLDFYEAQSLPNPQAQSLFLPTGAASFAYSFASGLSLAAYWQFEYEPDILPGSGSYFSSADLVGPGASRILVAPLNVTSASIYRGPDIRPSNGLDQFGVSVRQNFGNVQVGAYFVRGIPKTPAIYSTIYATPQPGPAGAALGQYRLVYAQPVNAYAISASTLFHGANVAAEISGRTNQPLISSVASYNAATPASYDHPLYAIGNVVDAQISALYLTKPMPFMPNGANIAAELTLNKVLGVTKNKQNLAPGNTSEGGAFEITFSPSWFPLNDVEVDLPLGWTTTFMGDSQYDGSAAGTGAIDIGVKAIYKANLTVGFNYQRYYGPSNRQALLDRDFATFYVQRTF